MKSNPASFTKLHIAIKAAVRHGIAPARVVLVRVGAFEIVMLAVQEKSLVRRPFEPAETKRRGEIIGRSGRRQNTRVTAV